MKYLVARDAFGNGELSWSDENVLAQLVSAAYEFNERDEATSAIDDAAVGDAIALSGTQFVDGWARCDELNFKQVRGDQVVAIVFHTVDGLLIEYHDAIEDFPMQPNGGDIKVQISQAGIFRL